MRIDQETIKGDDPMKFLQQLEEALKPFEIQVPEEKRNEVYQVSCGGWHLHAVCEALKELRKRQHKHVPQHCKERYPLRYGSAPIEVCECGAWRLHLHVADKWRFDDMLQAIQKAEQEQDEDL